MTENKKKVWVVQEIECDICTHKWVDVHHKEIKELDCPNCGYLIK